MSDVQPRPAETMSALLESSVAAAPDALAITYEGRDWSYREILATTRRMATSLAALGLGPGDRIAMWMPTLPDYLFLSFAAWRLGAVVVSVNTRFQSSEVDHVVGGQRPKMLAFTPGFAEIDFPAILGRVPAAALASITTVVAQGEDAVGFELPDALAHARVVPAAALDDAVEMMEDRATPDSPCVTFTTSGTTRAPKFVLHNHRGVAGHMRDVADALGFVAPDAVTLQATPLCAVYGFGQALATIAAQRPQILMSRFDGREAARIVRERRVTHFNATDDMLYRMAEAVPDEEKPFPSLRCCGFVLFNPTLKGFLDYAERRGLPLIGLYGMSECLALFAGQRLDAPAAERHRDGGFPFSPLAQVRIRDPETDELLPNDRPGLLELRAPSVMAGYFENEAATREAFTPDGWLRTGDLCCTLEDGSFRYIARAGDALRLSGFLTSPAEIEAYLEKHPSVGAVQVVGAQSAAKACCVAFIQPREGMEIDEAELREFCREGLARYKIPERFIALDEFPVTRSGNGTKIQRAALRRMAQEALDRG